MRLKQQLLFLFAVLFFISCSSFQKQPIQSQNDQREYKYLELENGLKVLLISDPSTDVAAASLDVYVGSGNDPRERAGLAHFLEHMLFLGTESYPEPGSYQAFIKENAGSHNAYTSFEHTNYFFDIKPEAFDEALDRFSSFFVSPLLNEEYVEREKKAVDSEYRARFKNEARREYDVFKQMVNPAHNFNKFSVGSLETLSSAKTPIREDLESFYKTWYSANNMSLVVYSKQSIGELKQAVASRFGEVPSFETPESDTTIPLFRENQLPKLVYIQPEKDIKELSLFFPVPEQTQYYQSKPLALIGHLIGHEGKGSLLSYLKNNNLADGLSAGMGLNHRGGSGLIVSVSLTAKGLEEKQSVSAALFSYVDKLKANGIPEWVHDEVAAVNRMEFRFMDVSSPLHYVLSLSNNLHYYPAEHVLTADYLIEEFRPELIAETLSYLNLDNCLITVIGDEVDFNKKSPYFDAPYRVASIDELVDRESIENFDNSVISLPQPNKFIAENFDVYYSKKLSSKPALLKEKDDIELWYKSADRFDIPKASSYFSFEKESLHETARDSVLLDLYVALVNDSLNEGVYMAAMAGLGFNFYSHARGVSLKLDGFSETQTSYFSFLVKQMTTASFTEKQFGRIKNEMLRAIENAAKKPPYQKLLSYWNVALKPDAWSYETRLEALKTLKLDDVQGFHDGFWQDMSVTVLVNGSMPESEAIAMTDKLENTLELKSTDASIRIRKLGEDNLHTIHLSNHNDHAYVLYWQADDDSINNRALSMLLHKSMEADFYNQLRTEKQLGYVVMSHYAPVLKVPGLVFVVQSPVADVREINEHVNAFLASKASELAGISEDRLEQLKQAIIQQLVEKPKDLSQESAQYWYDLALGYENFDRKRQLVEAVEAIDLKSWQSFVSQKFNKPYNRQYLLSTETKPVKGFRLIEPFEKFQQGPVYNYQ